MALVLVPSRQSRFGLCRIIGHHNIRRDAHEIHGCSLVALPLHSLHRHRSTNPSSLGASFCSSISRSNAIDRRLAQGRDLLHKRVLRAREQQWRASKELVNVAVCFAGLKPVTEERNRGPARQPYGFTGTMICAYGVLGYITYGFDVSGCLAVG